MYLKPSNIFYSQNQISSTFGKWNRHRNTNIGETLDDLCEGISKISDIETLKVVKRDGKWFTLDNRRLWVFHHLEGAGKCEKIPVIEVPFSVSDHGRKFSSTNGGKSVSIIRGRSPGGKWHRRITPVIPKQEEDVERTKLVEVNNKNEIKITEHSSIEKESNTTSKPVPKVSEEKALSVTVSLETERRDESVRPSLQSQCLKTFKACLLESGANSKAKSQNSISAKENGDTIWKVNTKETGSLISVFFKIRTSPHTNLRKDEQRNAILQRFRPYDLKRNPFLSFRIKRNDHAKYIFNGRCPSQNYRLKGNACDFNQEDPDDFDNSGSESHNDQEIESENDLLDNEIANLVDDREKSDADELEMSASDEDRKEIDYDDDPWSDLNDADDEIVLDDDEVDSDGYYKYDSADYDTDDHDDNDDDNDKEDGKKNDVYVQCEGIDSESVYEKKETDDVLSTDINGDTGKDEGDVKVIGGNGKNDFPVDLRSDLDYDELDVWQNEFDEGSKYITSHLNSSSDSEDDFLVAKEVEISERRMDKFLENSRLSSSEFSTDVSDIEDEESLALNTHYTFDDQDERRQRAVKISMKKYGFDIFKFDP